MMASIQPCRCQGERDMQRLKSIEKIHLCEIDIDERQEEPDISTEKDEEKYDLSE